MNPSLPKQQPLIDDPSVSVQIRGGIGNQLFMYAMGRRLSLINGVPLYLETRSGFECDHFFQRTYGLNRFCISAAEIERPPQSRNRRRARLAANCLLSFSSRRHFYESTDGQFDPRYLHLKPKHPVFLEGYWQDERYFSDIRSQLKSDLKFRNRHPDATESLARQMRNSESVAVHVRRLHGVAAGSDQSASAIESLPPEYYRAAIQTIMGRTAEPTFYLFSDSSSVTTIPGFEDHSVRVQSQGEDAQYEDLYLMSNCRHFVLANSTFSWWGAWLGRTPDSIVVSPVMREWGQIMRVPEDWHCTTWSRRT